MRRQFVERGGGVSTDAAEDIGQVRDGLNAVRLAIGGEGVEAGDVVAGFFMPDKHDVFRLWRAFHNRKNWLFVGSDDGGEANAVFVSLLASCSLHKLEPFAYMRDLLCLVPRWPSHRVLELAPAYWRETFEKREAQEILNANVLRRVVLELPGGAAHRPTDLPRPLAAVSDG